MWWIIGFAFVALSLYGMVRGAELFVDWLDKSED